MPTPGFAVVDVRSTGLWPERHHRIVELAVVLVDEHGRIERSWSTLINPGGDLDGIRGTSAYELMSSPAFAEIVPEVVELLAGRVLVAHNVAFELAFLRFEFDRLGLTLPVARTDALCTMRLARQLLPGAGRSLLDCCAAYDIDAGAHRTALADATATARLLSFFIGESPVAALVGGRDVAALLAEWPELARSGRSSVVRVGTVPSPRSFLERTAALLPDFEVDEQVDHAQRDYLAMIDQALGEGFLAAYEANELRHYAATLGLDPFARNLLHRRYFDNLVTAAWSGSALTDCQRADLVSVARLLELPNQVVVWAIKPRALHWPPPGMEIEDLVGRSGPVRLERGDLVVMSGVLSRPASFYEQVLTDLGIVTSRALTRNVTVLVASELERDSGKCRKARDYGIPIVSEEALMGVLVG